jgi:collagenase-like PrtC family protease
MLTFSVATNWDDNLIREIETLDPQHRVTEIFGKLASDFVGGARTTYTLSFVSKKNVSRYIKLVKDTGREFNYLLNASCLDNREFTRAGQIQIRKLLSWLDSIGVDVITVANPYLGYLVRNRYPKFKLAISSHALVDSVSKAKFWAEEIGANSITLSSHRINRAFPSLKKIRSQVNCKLQLIANQLCLYSCPLSIYHTTFLSHASQTHHPLRGYGIDWCLINCRYKLLTQPEELIKSNWIRPEDVRYYEDIGIDSLKITDRARNTQNIIYTLKTYLTRKFDGNLLDLLLPKNSLSSRKLFLRGLRFFFHPLHINIFKLTKFRQLFSDIGIYVDNHKLDGFLDYFFEGKCKPNDCEGCNYCRSIAERVVHVDDAYKQRIEKIFPEIIESLTNGDMFRYF